MTAVMSPQRRRPRRRTRSRQRGLTIPVDEIITTTTVRKMVSATKTPVTRHTLIRWRDPDLSPYPRFPQPVRVVDGVELWDAREIRAWIKTRDQH